MSVAIQGVGIEYDKVFASDNEFWLAKAGCFGELSNVALLMNHKGNNLATTDDRLQIHSGEQALVFRAYFSEDWFVKEVQDQTNSVESYVAVSAGFTVTKTATVDCKGVPVNVILEAKLTELSLIDAAPAVDTTYARLVSEESCNDELKDDYEMIRTVGRFVGLHRKVMAADNDGEVRYAHSPSAYERAADKFTRLLSKLQ